MQVKFVDLQVICLIFRNVLAKPSIGLARSITSHWCSFEGGGGVRSSRTKLSRHEVSESVIFPSGKAASKTFENLLGNFEHLCERCRVTCGHS